MSIDRISVITDLGESSRGAVTVILTRDGKDYYASNLHYMVKMNSKEYKKFLSAWTDDNRVNPSPPAIKSGEVVSFRSSHREEGFLREVDKFYRKTLEYFKLVPEACAVLKTNLLFFEEESEVTLRVFRLFDGRLITINTLYDPVLGLGEEYMTTEDGKMLYVIEDGEVVAILMGYLPSEEFVECLEGLYEPFDPPARVEKSKEVKVEVKPKSKLIKSPLLKPRR